jgi:hypothetical protein
VFLSLSFKVHPKFFSFCFLFYQVVHAKVVFTRLGKIVSYEKFDLRWSKFEDGRSLLAADLDMMPFVFFNVTEGRLG